jgi:PAS domain S-box-containing protein
LSPDARGEKILQELNCIHKTLHERECQLNARLEMVVQATKKLAACRDRTELNRRLVEVFAHNMAAEGASLFICHQDHLELAHSLDPDHVPVRIPLPLPEKSIFNQVLRSANPLLVRDIDRERTLQPSGWNGYKNGSLMVFPLKDKTGNIMALLSLHNKKWPPFTRQDLDLGQILGSLCLETLRCIRTKEYFRELTENSSDLTILIDTDGTIRYISPSVRCLLGYEPSGLIGAQAYTYIHPEDVDRIRRLIEIELVAADQPGITTFRCKHSNSSWRTISASAKNALHVEAVRGFVVNARDVTDYVLAQENIGRQEQQ